MIDRTRTKFSEIWDKHISLGNVLNLALLAALAGGSWFVMQERMQQYDDRLQTHSQRLQKIEELQISMAEVIIQQSQFQMQLRRVEERLVTRYTELARRIENLERDVRHGREQRDRER